MKKLLENWKRHIEEEEVNEAVDQLTPENFSVALQAFEKFLQEPAIVTALLGGGVAAAVDAVKKKFQVSPGTTPATDLDEVSSEKQRRWACAQKDKSASDRADGLSAAEAEEMCKSEVEE